MLTLRSITLHNVYVIAFPDCPHRWCGLNRTISAVVCTIAHCFFLTTYSYATMDQRKQMLFSLLGGLSCSRCMAVHAVYVAVTFHIRGNVVGQTPYLTGAKSCTACPQSSPYCEKNLCSKCEVVQYKYMHVYTVLLSYLLIVMHSDQ